MTHSDSLFRDVSRFDQEVNDALQSVIEDSAAVHDLLQSVIEDTAPVRPKRKKKEKSEATSGGCHDWADAA
jgi:superfamily I DNA and RNA helicase